MDPGPPQIPPICSQIWSCCCAQSFYPGQSQQTTDEHFVKWDSVTSTLSWAGSYTAFFTETGRAKELLYLKGQFWFKKCFTELWGWGEKKKTKKKTTSTQQMLFFCLLQNSQKAGNYIWVPPFRALEIPYSNKDKKKAHMKDCFGSALLIPDLFWFFNHFSNLVIPSHPCL